MWSFSFGVSRLIFRTLYLIGIVYTLPTQGLLPWFRVSEPIMVIVCEYFYTEVNKFMNGSRIIQTQKKIYYPYVTPCFVSNNRINYGSC